MGEIMTPLADNPLSYKEVPFVQYIIAKEDTMDEYRYLMDIGSYSTVVKDATKYELNEGISLLFSLSNHILLKLETHISKVNINIEGS